MDDCEQEILKNVENRNEQHDNLEENMNEQQDDLDTHVVPLPLDIADLGNWKIIDQNLIDMLVKIGHSKVKVDNFLKMKIEPIFCEKRIIYRKKQFDENASEKITHSAE